MNGTERHDNLLHKKKIKNQEGEKRKGYKLPNCSFWVFVSPETTRL